MKSLKQYLNEALVSRKIAMHRTLFPQNRKELEIMIADEMEENGNECSLNHIDVSKIEDMTMLFSGSTKIVNSNNKEIWLGDFNGDISEWNTSNVTFMSYLFANSKYTGENGDLSDWDVSKVRDMKYMFQNSIYSGKFTKWKTSSLRYCAGMFNNSKFDGDLSMFDTSKVTSFCSMFKYSEYTGYHGDISNWDVSNVKDMSSMFESSMFSGDISKWKPAKYCFVANMFKHSPLARRKPEWVKKAVDNKIIY